MERRGRRVSRRSRRRRRRRRSRRCHRRRRRVSPPGGAPEESRERIRGVGPPDDARRRRRRSRARPVRRRPRAGGNAEETEQSRNRTATAAMGTIRFGAGCFSNPFRRGRGSTGRGDVRGGFRDVARGSSLGAVQKRQDGDPSSSRDGIRFVSSRRVRERLERVRGDFWARDVQRFPRVLVHVLGRNRPRVDGAIERVGDEGGGLENRRGTLGGGHDQSRAVRRATVQPQRRGRRANRRERYRRRSRRRAKPDARFGVDAKHARAVRRVQRGVEERLDGGGNVLGGDALGDTIHENATRGAKPLRDGCR